MIDSIAERIIAMGYDIPEPAKNSKILPAKVVGEYAFCSGHGNLKYIGRVGRDVTIEQGYEAARLCAINCLGGLKSVIGSLDKIDDIVKVLGFVNSADDFHRQPEVINGFTDLLVELFGPEKGMHARSAIGTSNLPNNQPVEVEMIVKIKP